jgi:hypothetical protein
MLIMLPTLMEMSKFSPKEMYKMMAAKFTAQHPEHPIRQLERFFQGVYERACQTGGVGDLPRSGMPRTLGNADVEICVKYFKQGEGTLAANWYGYTSIDDAAVNCAAIREVIARTHCSVDNLWRRMQANQLETVGKPFKKLTIRVRPRMTQETKASRVAKASAWARYPMSYWRRVFWIDEKTETARIRNYHCYGPDLMDSFQVEDHSVLGKGKKIKYMAVVNAVLGAVLLVLISGTSDYLNDITVRT